jgi:hypothetical protein
VVLGVKLFKVDEKEPVPVPFDILVVKAMVGFVLVDQTTPLADMEAPPSDVIFPPEVAEVVVIEVISVEVSDGIDKIENVSFRQRTEKPEDALIRFLVI